MKRKLFKYSALAVLCTVSAYAQADGTQVDGTGSPAWFSWTDFRYGWGCAWVVVGPMFIYWAMKRASGNALG